MSTRNRRSARRKPQGKPQGKPRGDFAAPDEFHAYGLASEGNFPPDIDYESDDPTWNESQTDLSETDDIDIDDSEIESDDLGSNELGSTDLESNNLETDNLETDNLETDNLESDNLETDNLETDNLETDNLETDNLESDNLESDNLESDNLETDNLETDNLETDNPKTNSHTSKKPQTHSSPDLGTGSSASSHKEILTYTESMTFGWRGTHLKCGFVDREHLLMFIEITPKGPKMIKTRYDIAYWVGPKLEEFIAEKGLQHFDDNTLQEFYGKLGLHNQNKDANAVWLIKRGIATKARQYLKEQKKEGEKEEKRKKGLVQKGRVEKKGPAQKGLSNVNCMRMATIAKKLG